MAAFEEHCRDCEYILGNRCEEINHWIDKLFAVYGPFHRRYRHNWNGVEEAYALFGETGRKAAIIHILKDCGHVPTHREYAKELVDILGMPINGKFNGYWEPKNFVKKAKELIQ